MGKHNDRSCADTVGDLLLYILLGSTLIGLSYKSQKYSQGKPKTLLDSSLANIRTVSLRRYSRRYNRLAPLPLYGDIMINVTIDQLLNVWMELDDALRDPSCHEATVYRMTVQRHEMVNIGEAVEDAARTLMEIYELFAQKRDANITVVVNQHHEHKLDVRLSKGPAGKVIIAGDHR